MELWSPILSDPSGLPEGATLSGASGTGISWRPFCWVGIAFGYDLPVTPSSIFRTHTSSHLCPRPTPTSTCFL